MNLYDISERFKILDLEDIEEYLLRRKKEKEEIVKKIKEIEEKGICDYCGGIDAWWDIRFSSEFVCYDCYKESEEQIASLSVPMSSPDIISKDMWLERIEEEREKKIL
jgi:protein-arginine kinase activator protein McsA